MLESTAELSPTPVNVLVVDDVRDNLVALEALIARPDVRVLLASSGVDALELMLTEELALAILDVHMPSMDGFELAELMRGSPRTSRVPIIFITAEPHDRERQFRGYEAGAVDFLSKPIAPHVIRGKVDVFVKLFRQQLALADQVERLREALSLNETFVAVLGHDLRDPLNMISIGASLLIDQPPNHLVSKTAKRIERASARMARMIDQLLCLARARSGLEIPLVPRKTNLATLVKSALEDCDGDCLSRAKVHIEGDVEGVWDPDRLQQVVSNLVANAFRHGVSAGAVQIELDGRDGQCVQLSIRNEGSIPDDVLAGIFEPFCSTSGGLGLGLFIVRRFVEAHGGAVTVESSQTQGTRFSFSIPRDPRPERVPDSPTSRVTTQVTRP